MSRKSKPPARISSAERGIAYGLACAVVITLITLVLYPRVMSGGTLAIVRFLAALASGLSAYLFLGEVQVQGTVRKTAVRASGGFALFIIVLLLFFYGVPSSENSEGKSGVNVTLNPISNEIPYKSSTAIESVGHQPQLKQPLLNEIPYKSATAIESACPSKVFPISYNASYNDSSILEIKPKVEYLSLIAQNSLAVDLSNFCDFSFENKFPELSIKVVNNTPRNLFLTEAVIKVKVDEKNDKPILSLSSNFYNPNEFEIINYGWGEVINPVVNVSMAEIEACSKSGEGNSIRNDVFKPGSFTDKITIKFNRVLDNNILNRLQGKSALCATVDVHYFDSGYQKYSSKLKTILWLKKAGDSGIHPYISGIHPYMVPPTYRYNLFLDPNVNSSNISLPISQSISPGNTDNFIVEVSSSRTAKFFISSLFKSADGVELNGGSIILDLFLPRSEVNSCSEDKTASLLTKEIVKSLRSDQSFTSDYYDRDDYYARTEYTKIHKHLYDTLKEKIHRIDKKEEMLNFNQVKEYIRNYVHSHQIRLCATYL
jgi:hypothetical protein